MITLHQFPHPKDTLNYSPFCLKVETFLRLSGVPYQIKVDNQVDKYPKQKLPCIELDGQHLGDSTFILDHIKNKKGGLIDTSMSVESKAHLRAYQCMFEDNMYFGLLYYRWQMDHGWEGFSKKIFKGLPIAVRLVVAPMLRAKVKKTLNLQGMGRHTPEEVIELMKKDMSAAAGFLGQKKFFLGDHPTSLDCSAFAMLYNMFGNGSPIELQNLANQYPTLVSYVERMKQLFNDNANMCTGDGGSCPTGKR